MTQLWNALTSANNVDISKLMENYNTLRGNFSGTSQPSSPVAGQVFYDTSDGFLDLYNGSGWIALGAALASNSVGSAKIAMGATNKLLGRATAGAGAGEEIGLAAEFSFSSSNLTLGAFTGDVTRAAGSLALTIASNAVTTAKINNSAVTYAKVQDVSAQWRLLGRISASAGDIEEIDINALSADTSPSMANDKVVTYDASASGWKNVLLKLIGAGKQVAWIGAESIAPRNTSGCAMLTWAETTTNKINYDFLAFDPTSQEFARFAWKAPKSLGTGTLTFIPVWTHPATTTNFGVVWGLSAMGRSDGDAIEQALGTAVTSTDTGGTTGTQYMGPESAAMTVGGTFAAEDMIYFQISRNPSDGSDTMAVDAYLLGVYVIWTSTQNTED